MLRRLFEQNESAITTPTFIQFLTFKLGQDEYGVNIDNVQELRGYNTVTPVANVSEYIKGVINLRGAIVPIIDLRIRLNTGPATYDQSTAVMMLDTGIRVIGVIVDSISNLVNIRPEQINLSSRARNGNSSSLAVLTRIGPFGNRQVRLIDMEVLHSSIDFGLIGRLTTVPVNDTRQVTVRERIHGSRYLWVARIGERSQVSALKFRPHWRPVPK